MAGHFGRRRDGRDSGQHRQASTKRSALSGRRAVAQRCAPVRSSQRREDIVKTRPDLNQAW